MLECIVIFLAGLSLVITGDSILYYRAYFNYEEDIADDLTKGVLILGVTVCPIALLGSIVSVIMDCTSWITLTIQGKVLIALYLVIFTISFLYRIELAKRYKRIINL